MGPCGRPRELSAVSHDGYTRPGYGPMASWPLDGPETGPCRACGSPFSVAIVGFELSERADAQEPVCALCQTMIGQALGGEEDIRWFRQTWGAISYEEPLYSH